MEKIDFNQSNLLNDAQKEKQNDASKSMKENIANSINTTHLKKEEKIITQKADLKSFDNKFEQLKPKLLRVIPRLSNMTPERLYTICNDVLLKSPNLSQCDIDSFISAVLQAGLLGLNPHPTFSECYFIPFSNKIQFHVGYRGFLKLASRNESILSLYGYAVKEGDDFSYELGLNPTLKHIPLIQSDTKNRKITHVYAVVKYINGNYSFVVLNRDEIENLRLRNPQQQKGMYGAWATDYESMSIAKAIKKLAKYMPLFDDLQNAIMADEAIIENIESVENQKFIYQGETEF